MRRPSDRKGLTLIEVLLGLAISAVIFALVLGAIRLGQRSQEKGLERQELAQRMRILSDRLGWLVRGAYPYVYTDPEDPENPELFFSGATDTLEFVTTATDPYSESLQDLSGLKYVILSLEDDTLVMKEQVFFIGGDDIPEENSFILDPQIAELEFSFLDPVIDEDGKRGEPEWVDEWDGADKVYLPLAVRITVKLKRDETEVELPTVIAAIRPGGVLLTPSAAGGTPGGAPAPGTSPSPHHGTPSQGTVPSPHHGIR